ncbi:hypothetical protein [Citricoccus sp. GCM10030269]|uniref:hypothetical protein n=1 Tax=Citricoccus sp. GCM10030269 TaxID=3273388 RepID=UPI00361074EA
MEAFWDYFSVLAPSAGLALIFWLVMRSVLRVDTDERHAKAELEEREAQEWARLRAENGSRGEQSERDGRHSQRDGHSSGLS